MKRIVVICLVVTVMLIPVIGVSCDSNDKGNGVQITKIHYDGAVYRTEADEYVEINPEDATKEGLQNGDSIQLISSEGEKRVKARLTEKVPSGVLFLPLPFEPFSTIMPFKTRDSGSKICHIRIERVTI